MQVVVLAAAQRLRRSADFAAAVRGGRRAGRGARGRPPRLPPRRHRAGVAGEAAPRRAPASSCPRPSATRWSATRSAGGCATWSRERLADLPAGADAGGAGPARPRPTASYARARRRPRRARSRAGAEPRDGEAATMSGMPTRPRHRSPGVLALPIVAYRRWISPALPARCRFYPSCSAYALEAIARARRAAWDLAWRSGGCCAATPSTPAGTTRCRPRRTPHRRD